MGLGQSRIFKCIEDDQKNAEIDAKIREESRGIAERLEAARHEEFNNQWTTTPIKYGGGRRGGKKLRKTKKNKTKNNKTKKRHYKKRKTRNSHK